MKQYYIIVNNEQIGPISINELLAKKIVKETKVWYEGLEDWKNASEIEELSKALLTIPPPIQSIAPKIPPPTFAQTIENSETTPTVNKKQKIFGLDKKKFFITCGSIILLFVFITFISNQDDNQDELNQLNNQTEVHNQQIDNQQLEIEEQKTRLVEQEQIESNRREQERITELENKYEDLNSATNQLYENLQVAQENLNNATSFQLGRSSEERNQQINSAQYDIETINEHLTNNKSEMEKIAALLAK